MTTAQAAVEPAELIEESSGKPVVELIGAARTFEGTPPVHALKPADVRVNEGDYVAIVGPSGSGKSTLLHLLGLLDSPTEGVYKLDGIDTGQLSDSRRAGLRATRIGFVFQSFHLLPTRSTMENVMLGELYVSSSKGDRRERAQTALERVGLGHRLNAFPTTLSGGERQRVAVARALAAAPALLLADEPTGNLDSGTTQSILDLFDELHASGLTIMMITHDATVAARADRQLRINDGELTEIAPVTPPPPVPKALR